MKPLYFKGYFFSNITKLCRALYQPELSVRGFSERLKEGEEEEGQEEFYIPVKYSECYVHRWKRFECFKVWHGRYLHV